MDKFYACYGLAEATLILTGGQQGVPPTLLASSAGAGAKEQSSISKPSDVLVACGTSLPEGEIRIVDPTSRIPCPPLSVGEIWARGPGVSPGYYGQSDRCAFTLLPSNLSRMSEVERCPRALQLVLTIRNSVSASASS
jgi:acyl-CoA synthetase (AMP-forming)/AMP-acid ligase II